MQPVLNWSTGVEYYVVEGVSTRLGLFSNNANTPSLSASGMNQPDQARAALEQGTSLIQQTQAKPDKGDFAESWRDWIMMDVLLREARAVVNGDPKINIDASE